MLVLFSARAFPDILLQGSSNTSDVDREFVRAFFLGDGMIHIGKLIEAELRRQERPVSWFARKLYCERTNVYDIFKRRSIDTEMLLRISVVLQHDFFRYYSSEAGAVESERESVGRQ